MTETLTKLEDMTRSEIVNSNGMTFPMFRKQLRPNYIVVWRDIVGGYLALILTAVIALSVQDNSLMIKILTVILCSGIFGYFLAYLQLFFHEAAHYNIAKERKLNDRLANIFIGAIVGQDITVYRPIHLMHHRYLGTVEDTEHSYFDALTWKYILESLTGIRVLKVLGGREKVMKSKNDSKNKQKSNINTQLFIGFVTNAFIVGFCLWSGYYVMAISWVLGMIVVFPFFGAVRQLLEHRGEQSNRNNDYSVVPHGEVNRLFGDGPVASTLGAAGFNRHLLHHWEPAISYTCFKELETYLMDTQVRDYLESRRAGYFSTFITLFGK